MGTLLWLTLGMNKYFSAYSEAIDFLNDWFTTQWNIQIFLNIIDYINKYNGFFYISAIQYG